MALSYCALAEIPTDAQALQITVPASHPLACSFSRMESASTAMQETISCDMTWPREFHTSHKLGPSMSMTCTKQILSCHMQPGTDIAT